jgi:NAD(P)-dependent dehydrogenase (short-subunit alcohol dehydrogenase family)
MRIIVTGANRGIGLGLARAFIKRGDEVHATARRPEAATALLELESAARAEGRLHVHRVDVTKEGDCLALAKALGAAAVDLMVCNAGVSGGWKSLADEDMAALMETFDVNALGPLRMARALRANVAAAHGKIIDVSSLMGSMGDNTSGRAYGYRMSKAALNMATTNLALEFAPDKITVICLNPGWVKTDMGGAQAPTPVDDAVAQIVALSDRITVADSGKFLHAKGHVLPW